MDPAIWPTLIQITLIAGGDPACNVQRYWIELEAFKFGNPTKARSLWTDVMVKQKTMADSWIAMAEMDK